MLSKLYLYSDRLAYPRLNQYCGHLWIFILAIMFATWRFWQWMPDVFFGDDLSNLLAYKDGHLPSTFIESLGFVYNEKYRPIYAWVSSNIFRTFGDNIQPYLIVNMVLQGMNATLVFMIAQRLSQGSWFVSMLIAIVVATSRFALYQVTQVTGLLEGIALTFFLFMTYCIVRAGTEAGSGTLRWCCFALLCAFMAVNTHERYIVIFLWLILVFIVVPSIRSLPRSGLLALLTTCILMMLFTVLFKTVFLDSNFLVGTGGTHISLDVARILDHVKQAVLSLFLFNEGPEYLTGARAITLDIFPVWLFAIVFSIAWILGIYLAVRTILAGGVANFNCVLCALHWPFLLLLLAGLILIPPISTIRLEQRWILSPFILMLLMFAWAVGVLHLKDSKLSLLPLGLALGVVVVISDSYISKHFAQIFFVSSGRFASVVKQDIIEKYPVQHKPIVLLAHKNHCTWTLLKGEFFRLYTGFRSDLLCYDSVEDIKYISLPEDAIMYTSILSPSLGLLDVTADIRAVQARVNEKVVYDFLSEYPDGHINDAKEVDSPSGRGAMNISWESVTGPQKTLTLVSGYSYKYDNVRVMPGSYLRFGVTMIYPSLESAIAVVSVSEGGEVSKILYSKPLTPPGENEKPRFIIVTIPLTAYYNRTISIKFAAETLPGKNSSGHWVAYSAPRVVVDGQ